MLEGCPIALPGFIAFPAYANKIILVQWAFAEESTVKHTTSKKDTPLVVAMCVLVNYRHVFYDPVPLLIVKHASNQFKALHRESD